MASYQDASLNRIKQIFQKPYPSITPKAHYGCSLNSHKRTMLPVSQYFFLHPYRISFSNHLLGQLRGRSNVATNPTQTFTAHVSAMAALLHSQEPLNRSSSSSIDGSESMYYRQALNQSHPPLPAKSTGVRRALHFPSQQRGTHVRLLLHCLIPKSH